MWWYDYFSTNWLSNSEIEAALIINGEFLAGTSEDVGNGFLKAGLTESVYTKNIAQNTLKRSFPYKTYQIDLIQELLPDGSVEVSYQVTNNNAVPQKIGVSQYSAFYSLNFYPIQDFKGFYVKKYSSPTVVMLPDPLTMPNWAVASTSSLKNFSQYSPQTAVGLGWETGKRYRDNTTLLTPPLDLKEDTLIYMQPPFGGTMKNPGVTVLPGETTTFKQKIKFNQKGEIPPKLTVDQKSQTMYKHDSFDITETISDENNKNYALYIELADTEKTLVPLKKFREVPLGEIQTYQTTIEGKYFKTGSQVMSIIAIDEYGSRSTISKVNLVLHELSGIPNVQKIEKGKTVARNVYSLFTNLLGSAVKLKTANVVIDSSNTGFQWIDATLVDSRLRESEYKIPVSVYDPVTTYLNTTTALDAENIELSSEEINLAVKEERLNELILQKSAAKSWQLEQGTKNDVSVVAHNINPDGSETARALIRGTTTDGTKQIVAEKNIQIKITGGLLNGWQVGTMRDSISNEGYQIAWHGGNSGAWWYTYKGASWMYEKSIEASLIINGDIPPAAGESYGFLWFGGDLTQSTFMINPNTKSLKRTFLYLDRYYIEITQQLLGNNAVEVTYNVTNFGSATTKIGLTQWVDVYVGTDSVPVTPINQFKGLNLTSGESSLALLPDPETLPNWAAGHYRGMFKYAQYSSQDVNGLGWETGKQYANASGTKLTPPIALEENQAISLGDSAITMKNPGIPLQVNESTSFKQILKFGVLVPPEITLEESAVSIYRDEEVKIHGTILDKDNKNYRLYLEMNDRSKTLISLEDFTDIPYGALQNYESTIKGEWFSAGTQIVSIVAIDEYGTRSIAKRLSVTISELDGTPKIQMVKLGETLNTNINDLFSAIKGVSVSLKNTPAFDSSVVGFQWVEATLTDGKKQKEVKKKIPVNVYNPISTVFNDLDKIVLDAKDGLFPLVEVRQSNEAGKLDELVRQKVAPKAWDMADGTEILVSIPKNEIKPLFGTYLATYRATRKDNGKSLQKNGQLIVGGELAFKQVPDRLDFKTIKLNQKVPYSERLDPSWHIEIENTIGSNWSLNVSATPFETSKKEKTENLLILKKYQNQDEIINAIPRTISSGKEAYPFIRWEREEGLLIKAVPGVKKGVYKGQINWTLTTAP